MSKGVPVPWLERRYATRPCTVQLKRRSTVRQNAAGNFKAADTDTAQLSVPLEILRRAEAAQSATSAHFQDLLEFAPVVISPFGVM
jgi:hypothetical protein